MTKEIESGHAFKVQAQAYRVVGICEHVTLGGRCIDLLVVESACPDCGELFRVKATKSAIRRREVTRRCANCRKPGVPVDPGRRQREKAKARNRRRRLACGGVAAGRATCRALMAALLD
jgi:predicted Zn finger-like uncharacterized protein